MGNSSSNDWAATANNPLITNSIVKVDWLIKKGSTRKHWNKRYVLLLSTNILLYFTDSNCLEHRGTVDLSKLKNIGTINKEPSKFIVVTTNRTWEFQTNNKTEAMDWVQNIKQIYNQHKNKSINNTTNENEIKQPIIKKQKSTKSTFEYEMNTVKTGLMGWLTKKGELRRNWNSRWTILLPSRLMIYFSDETCENFKGCADFRESNLTLLFDDNRKNYFFIQTHMRIWEFSCVNSHQVKQWSTILQYLIDIDHKVLILKSAEDMIEYPSKELLNDYFKFNGNILEITFNNKDKTYIIIFENENAIESLMIQNRLHIISQNINAANNAIHNINNPSPSISNISNGSNTPVPASPDINNIPSKYKKKPYRSRRHRSSLKKYELFALKFSEYMGNVHCKLGTHKYEFNIKKSYKSKVHGMAAARRFSSKSIINNNISNKNKKNKNKKNKMKHRDRDKAKSLSFRDKYSQSAIDEFKKIYAKNNSDNDSYDEKSDSNNEDSKDTNNNHFNRKTLSTIVDDSVENEINNQEEWESDDGYYDDTSSSDDAKNANVRMTSVADRGQQVYYDPNQVKTYKQSSIFNFSPEKQNLLSTTPPKKPTIEKMKSLPNLPLLEQSDEFDEHEDEKKERLTRKSIVKPKDEIKSEVNISKLKKEMAESPILRNIVSKPKYNVSNKQENIKAFLDHVDKTVGLPNFARYVAINDGNIDKVEQVYINYRKQSMKGDALKKIEIEEKEMIRKEEQIAKQQQQEVYLSLKRKKKSRPSTPNVTKDKTYFHHQEQEAEEVEYEEEIEYEEIEIEEGCPIIIDNGCGFIKAGFEISEEPILIPNQCVQSKKKDNYILFGDDYGLRNDTMSDIGDIIFPINRNKISDWNAMNAIWEYTIVNKIGVESLDEIYEYPIMITEPPGNDQKLREKQLQYFMETHNLQKFYMMNTALANFYYTGKTRDDYCVIVDCGHGTTNISCIYMGMYLKKYAATIEYAGKDITQYLSKLLRESESSSMYFHLDTSYKIANKIKHEYCYVARDFYHAKSSIINKKYRLPDGRTLEIKNEQYEAAEILFNPSDPKHNKRKGPRNKSSKKSLGSILINCVNKIDDDDVEKNMYANIYCCGGSVKLNNFTSRLQSELTQSLSRRMSIVSPQHIRKGVIVKNVNQPQLSAWKGSAMIAGLSTFDNKWITNEEYNEYGQNILTRKCTHQDL